MSSALLYTPAAGIDYDDGLILFETAEYDAFDADEGAMAGQAFDLGGAQREVAPPAAAPPSPMSGVSSGGLRAVTRVRQKFPEAWIWTDVSAG